MSIVLAYAALVEAAFPNQLPDVDFGMVMGSLGILLLTTGIAMAGRKLYIEWKESKRVDRMILKDRNDKIHAVLLDVLCDGLEDAEVQGRLSRAEVLETYQWLHERLGLHDLIPKKRLQALVKKTLKADRFKREQERKKGTYVERPLTEKAKKFSKKAA